MKIFLKPTISKIITALLLYVILNIFLFICRPLEFERLGIDSAATGRQIEYACGPISHFLYGIYGSAWTRDDRFDWIIHLLISYLLICVITAIKNTKNNK